jgi:hypothetical protein
MTFIHYFSPQSHRGHGECFCFAHQETTMGKKANPLDENANRVYENCLIVAQPLPFSFDIIGQDCNPDTKDS